MEMVSDHRFSGSENTIMPSEYSFEYSIYIIQAHKGYILCHRVYTVVVNQDWLANLVSILEKVINGHKFDPKMKLVINWS